MRRIKPILFSVLLILFYSKLDAQQLFKSEPIDNLVNVDFYTGKKWDVKQILKESLSITHGPFTGHLEMPTISLVSTIYLSITELPEIRVKPTVSDKLRSHVETSRYYEDDTHFHSMFMDCKSLNSWKYRIPIFGKFFFNYQ